MNLTNLSTSDVHVYSTRLYSYWEQLNAQLQNITQAGDKVKGYDTEALLNAVKKEIAVVSAAMQAIQNEIEIRMKKDLGFSLNAEELFTEISTFYALIKQAQATAGENGTPFKVQTNA